MENNNKDKHYTLTINIAEKGTELLLGKEKGDTSSVGHMWYEIAGGKDDGSYGFAPAIHGESSGLGKIYENDSDNYATRYYQASIVISEEQYNTLAEFGNKNNLNGVVFDFNTDYKGLRNSCIDYTWKALHEVGINPKDFEGQMWPTHNADDVDKVLYRYTHSDTKNWNESLPDTGGYNATYGSKNDDIMSNGDKDGYLFGGAGHDTYKVNAKDTISDSDRDGEIYFNAKLLSGVKHKVSEGVYADEMFTYTQENNNLIIAQKADPSKSITVEHWDRHQKMLDIELSEQRVEEKSKAEEPLGVTMDMSELTLVQKEETIDYSKYLPEHLRPNQAAQTQEEYVHPASVQAVLDKYTSADNNVQQNNDEVEL